MPKETDTTSRTVVTILSTNFAGSHYLSLMLGSHSKAAHCGEVHHLRKEDPGEWRDRCPVCNRREGCPVLEGITPKTFESAYDILYSNLGDGVDVLIDASKRWQWAKRFLGRTPYRMKYVHLIRDPRALVRRWTLATQQKKRTWKDRMRTLRKVPGHAPAVLFASRPLMYMYRWLGENRAITRFLKRSKADWTIVTYRDLAKDASAELERLCGFIGIDYEPGQDEYWNFDHHGSRKYQYRWVEEKKVKHFDLRWKEFLTEKEQGAIGSHPVVQRYLLQLSLEITEEGLIRKDSDP
jgi:hypothetical protein